MYPYGVFMKVWSLEFHFLFLAFFIKAVYLEGINGPLPPSLICWPINYNVLDISQVVFLFFEPFVPFNFLYSKCLVYNVEGDFYLKLFITDDLSALDFDQPSFDVLFLKLVEAWNYDVRHSHGLLASIFELERFNPIHFRLQK